MRTVRNGVRWRIGWLGLVIRGRGSEESDADFWKMGLDRSLPIYSAGQSSVRKRRFNYGLP